MRRSWAGRPAAPSRERGQALVVFSLSLVVLLLFAGLAIDAGNAFLQRRDGQNVADLASMAGTQAVATFYLTDGGTTTAAATDGPKVYAAVQTSVVTNGCQAAGARPCTWTAQYVNNGLAALGPVTSTGAIPSTAQGVVVTTSLQPSTYILGVIGQTRWNIATTATALTAQQGAAPAGQLLPIGVDPPNTNFQYGQTYNITDGANGPGNFGWLSWTGSNATGTLATSLCTPNNPAYTFPVVVPGEPGKHNGSDVVACLQYWVTSGATVLLPIWDTCGNDANASNGKCNGNNASYHVIGLAAFQLTSFTQPAIDQIQGRFIQYYNLPSVGAGYGGPPCQYSTDLSQCPSTTTFIGLVR